MQNIELLKATAYLELKAWEVQFTNVDLIKKSSCLLCKAEEMNLKNRKF